MSWDVSSLAGAGTAQVDASGESVNVSYAPLPNSNGNDSFVIRVSDGTGGSDTITVNVSIAAQNDTPTAFCLGGLEIAENEDAGYLVGQFSATDVDVADALAYTLVAGDGAADNAWFAIEGDRLVTADEIDYEENATFGIRVQVDDGQGGLYEHAFTIEVEDANDKPTKIDLAAERFDENQPLGSGVSSITSDDPDAGDQPVFSLVEGEGDSDNASFAVDGTNLVTADLFDYESRNFYSVRLQADDGNGGVVAQAISLEVTDANDAPTAIRISSASVVEGLASGSTVGEFTTVDADLGDSHSYALVVGAGDDDNSLFLNEEGRLLTAAEYDAATDGPFSLRVRSTDASDAVIEKQFVVTLIESDDADAPVFMTAPTVTSVSDRRVAVEWMANEPVTASIDYGTTTPLAQSAVSSPAAAGGRMTLGELEPATVYYLRVSVTDIAGNGPVVSEMISFTTLPAPDEYAPVIIAGPMVTALGDAYAEISWTTDEPSTSRIAFNDGLRAEVRDDDTMCVEHVIQLAGLTAATTYRYRVHSYDVSGNGSPLSVEAFFTTDESADSAGPVVVEGPEVIHLTEASATLFWRTDKPADTGVEYGEPGAFVFSRNRGEMRTDHQVTLVCLVAGKTYQYTVSSTDVNGHHAAKSEPVGEGDAVVDEGLSGEFVTPETADTTAPDFTESPEVVMVSDTMAVIRWSTDEPSDTRVEYGVAGGLRGEFSGSVELTREHEVILTNMTPGTPYEFVVSCGDLDGNTAATEVLTFTTEAEPDTVPPVIAGSLDAFDVTPLDLPATGSMRVIGWTDLVGYYIEDEVVQSQIEGSGETFNAGDSIPIQWKTDLDMAGTAVKLELWNADGWVADLGYAWDPDGAGVADLELPDVPEGKYWVRVLSTWDPHLVTDTDSFTVQARAAVTPDLWLRYE